MWTVNMLIVNIHTLILLQRTKDIIGGMWKHILIKN